MLWSEGQTLVCGGPAFGCPLSCHSPAVTGRQVPPPPALPANVGCVVQNVGTVFAVYEAVQKKKPLIERIVTVTGKSVKNPSISG